VRNLLRSRPSSIVFFARGNLMPHVDRINSLRRANSLSDIVTAYIAPLSEVASVFSSQAQGSPHRVPRGCVFCSMLMATARFLCTIAPGTPVNRRSHRRQRCARRLQTCSKRRFDRGVRRNGEEKHENLNSMFFSAHPASSRRILLLPITRRIPHPCHAPGQVHLPRTPCRYPG
jgi:hypothetical protein